MSKILEYVDGLGTEYAEVLNSLRNFLKSIENVRNSEGGALVFFTGKEERNGDLKIKVFPLSINKYVLENKQLSAEQVVDIFKFLNTERNYGSLWHQEEFRLRYNEPDHLTTFVKPQNIILYDKESITYQGKTASWIEFHKDLMNGVVEKDTADQLFFKSGCRKISYIPLPVLSTPFVLLVINNDVIQNDLASSLRSIYFRTRDSISKHLYSRLMLAMTDYLNGDIKEIKKRNLVEKFVSELCNVLFPISYRINSENEHFFYSKWPSEGIESYYDLRLLNGEYTVRFKLTSFVFVDFEHTAANVKLPMFHTSEIYKATITQSAALISKLFDLIYKNWSLMKSFEQTIYDSMLQTISPMNIPGLVKSVLNLEAQYNKLKENARRALNSPINKILVTNERVTITVHGKKIFDFMKARYSQVIIGARYLHYLIKRSAVNQKNNCISTHILYEELGHQRKTNKSKSDPEASDTAKAEALELFKIIDTWVSLNEEEINRCLSMKKISANENFNASVYIYANLRIFILKTKAGKLIKRHWGDADNQLALLVRLYSDEDVAFMEKVQRSNIQYYTDRFQSVRNKVYHKNENTAVVNDVRNAFLALFKELHRSFDTMQDGTDEKASFLYFIHNLEESGLKKAALDEAVSQNNYCYNQAKDYFIEWEFS